MVAACCDSGEWDRTFGPRLAKRLAARYRKHGLDRTAQRLVDWLATEGIEGASVLDIGGGVGGVGIELLRRGAATATTLELSSAYDSPAAALAAEAGLSDRVERRIGDLAADGSVAEVADVVVLHRVVCCYPDAGRLLTAAADHARRAVVLSHPAINPLWRALSALENVSMRVLGRQYQSFMHPPAEMLRVLCDRGFVAEHIHRGPAWQLIAARRAASDASGQR